MLTWKIVEAPKASVLYIYIDNKKKNVWSDWSHLHTKQYQQFNNCKNSPLANIKNINILSYINALQISFFIIGS